MSRKHNNSASILSTTLASAEAWWSTLPADKRKKSYRPGELCHAAGLPPPVPADRSIAPWMAPRPTLGPPGRATRAEGELRTTRPSDRATSPWAPADYVVRSVRGWCR